MTISHLYHLICKGKYLTYFTHFSRFPFILFLLLSTPLLAQEELPGRFGIQAGLNSGLLSGGFGPSLSLHYAFRQEKILQFESQFFFDSHAGKTFLSGHAQKNKGIGLAVGPRLNFRPKKEWNPSIYFMPGLMYSSESTSRYDDVIRNGVSAALSLGISNEFYKIHMVSLGFNVGENIFAANLKYGYWF